MKKYKPYLNRVDLVKNQVEREELREQEAKRKRSRSIQEQNRQRWLKYQEQLRSELAARYFHSVQSVGGLDDESTFSNKFSVAFDGSSNFVDCGNVTVFDGSSAGSISAWFKIGVGSGGGSLITKYSTALGKQIIFKVQSTNIEVLSTTINYRSSGTATWADGNWHHVVMSYDGSRTFQERIQVYIDGSKVNNAGFNGPPTLPTSTADFYIGARSDVSFAKFIGSIDELALFNTALTQSDVTAIYGSGVPADLSTYSSLTNWWRMGDGDTFPTLTDNGSGGNDGTMTNMDSGDIQEDVPGS